MPVFTTNLSRFRQILFLYRILTYFVIELSQISAFFSLVQMQIQGLILCFTVVWNSVPKQCTSKFYISVSKTLCNENVSVTLPCVSGIPRWTFFYQVRTRQIIRYRATANKTNHPISRNSHPSRLQKSNTASKEVSGLQNQQEHHMILTKYEAVHPLVVMEINFSSVMLII